MCKNVRIFKSLREMFEACRATQGTVRSFDEALASLMADGWIFHGTMPPDGNTEKSYVWYVFYQEKP